MAPRALGALLAIVAAIAFAVSIASSAWWAGPPTVGGQIIDAKHVRVGPLGAQGCNTGGDGTCEALTTGSTMQLVGMIAIAAIGLAILFALMLAVSAWRVGDRRKGLAKATILVTLGAAGVGAAMLAVGPGIEASQHIGVPFGWGAYVFGGGIASSLLASLIARKLEPEPLRLKLGIAPPALPPDVRDLVRQEHEGLAPRDSVPLFGSAPQLRPLYDPGNDGYVPAPQSPTSLPSQPPAPYARAQVKELTGQYTPTPDKVNPLGSPNPGVRSSPSAPPPLGSMLPKPGDPLGPPVDPFARTAPRDQGGEPPPMSPPPPRAAPRTQSPSTPPRTPSTAPSRTQAPSTPPPASGGLVLGLDRGSRATGPSGARDPGPRTQSPSTPPRTQSPSTAPPPRTQSPSTAPPSRTQSPSTPPRVPPGSAPRTQSPSSGPRVGAPLPARTASPNVPAATPPQPRARTTQGPGTDPTARKLEGPAQVEPELRPSAPTLAHAVPPMPTPDNLAAPAILPARDVTAVEIDAEAKAVAEATARGQLDPRIAMRGPRSSTEARTGQHEARIADITSTGVDVEAGPRAMTTTDESPIAPPPPSKRIITGEARALSTVQRQVARAPTEDSFGSGKKHLIIPAGAITDELATPRSAEMAAEDGPATEVHSIPSPQELADEIAAGSIGDVTAATSPPIDLHRPETTPIPTFHGPRPTAQSMSTASSSLPPPRTVEAAPHGPTPACPQCESPMAWVEEHLRFYCKQCRMYF